MQEQIQYGKPSGLTLQQHTDNVKRQGAEMREQFPFWAEKYRLLTGDDLNAACSEAEKYHDAGKGYSKNWRQACAMDVALYHNWLRERGYPTETVDRGLHHRYEEELRHQRKATAPNLLCAGVRHEFASVDYLARHRPTTSATVLTAIAAHHGKLSTNDYARRRWQFDCGDEALAKNGPYYSYYQQLEASSDRAVSKESFADLVRRRYRYAAVRALLQLADIRASRWEGMGDEGMVPLLPFTAPKGFGNGAKLRPVQRTAIEHAKEWRTILRAPTGSGKTYASLLWAQEQILGENPRADRLVIAMPTRFTSNALREAVREQMPDLNGVGSSENPDEAQVGLYHSSAFFNLYGEEGDHSWGSKDVERQKLARYLATPVTVCTVDHLLACLTGTREQHYSTFFFLANSCVVFDETDFYDEFVQANIQTLLDVLDILKVPTLIMSATVPDSARSLYRVPDPIRETKQPGAEKVIKNMRFLGAAAKPEDVSDFLVEMLAAGQGIIYANTVARALAYYEYIEPLVGGIPLTIYHSRFTEVDKKRIEQELESSLGKKAHTEGRARGIVIMTQIGEMSINVSSHLMLTDCCPWDRLAQRVGRLARFATGGTDEVRATVGVVEPIDEEGKVYAWPYVEQDPTESQGRRTVYRPVSAYANTLAEIKTLSGKTGYRLTPENLVIHTNNLYAAGTEFTTASQQNQRNYRELIQKNWLLTGAEHNNDEDTQTNTWQSRNIVDQVTVLIEKPQPIFSGYKEFQDNALKFGVSCPIYKIRSELRKEEHENPSISLTDVQIGPQGRRKIVKVYYAETGAYSRKMGLLSLYGYAWQADQTL